MKQITLSIEQMKHLEELGLDTSDASMCYRMFGGADKFNNLLPWIGGKFPENNNFIPAYTLQDILGLLPEYIQIDKHEYWLHGDFKSLMWYEHNDENKTITVCRIKGENILDCAYQILLWCIENNYIKTNKE